MPGFTIHIAIAKEYIRKHENEIKNEQEFIRGSIAPDYICLVDKHINKNITHYGKWGDWTSNDEEIYLDEFLKDSKVDLNKAYWKGYFIHLLTDHYFDKTYFHKEIKKAKENEDKFYTDYDCLNKIIIKKYNIEMIEDIKRHMNCIEDKPKYLNIDNVIKFIEDMSNMNLEQQVALIKQKGMEGIK